MTTPDRRDEVPAAVREANRLAALRDVANAPPVSEWSAEQAAALAELFRPQQPRAAGAAGREGER